MRNNKFYFCCKSCSTGITASEWIAQNQQCSRCGGKLVYTEYKFEKEQLTYLLRKDHNPKNMWHYFDILPLNDKNNIVTFNEGIVDINRWLFMEKFAKDVHDIDCKIYAQRNDQNQSTGTFKDLAGTVVASFLRENRQYAYVVASTGNIANSYAKYLAKADISLYAFVPKNSSPYQISGIRAYGQKVYRVEGDYTRAKQVASDFASSRNFLLAAGNFDPLRIEAKKIMVYEWLRQLDEYPTVYIQALSGGTGPLGIQKAHSELKQIGMDIPYPRQLLIQSDKCAPMAIAWNKAKSNGFSDGWENDYPILTDPETDIPTLSTGDPKTYPVLGPFVHKTKGEIIAAKESLAADIARMIAFETSTLIGPAAALPIAGIFQSFKKGLIKNGDVLLINIGEGIRRSPRFLRKIADSEDTIQDAAECKNFDREHYRTNLWETIQKHYS